MRTSDRYPEKTAIVAGEQSATYRELRATVERLAAQIRESVNVDGVAAPRVGVYLPRSGAAVATILAVLAAGCTYVPLDPSYPPERLRHMVSDSGIVLAISGSGTESPVALAGLPLLPGPAALVETGADTAPGTRTTPAADADAYIIYTSGSTGAPKGVVVGHDNVLALLRSTLPLVRATVDDVWTLFHSCSFDFSVWEMWGCFATGARLVVVDEETARTPGEFLALVEREGVTFLNAVPSVFKQVSRWYTEARPHLAVRLVLFGGEPIDRPSIRAFLDAWRGPAPRMVNMYGITETTVHTTIRDISDDDLQHGGPTNIGRPLPHLSIHLMADDLTPVPDGEVGEIFVGGAGVARGYHARPELTEQRFPRLLTDGARERFYRSGDLGRRRSDGTFEYHGRADNQVKVRGFRIELGEIENCLVEHPEVREAVVAPGPPGAEQPRLIAFVVAAGSDRRAAALRAHCAARLPAHMVPNDILFVGELPLTASGKLDRRAVFGLPTLASSAQDDPASGVLAVLREAADVPDLAADENLFAAGVTSLQIEAIAARLIAAQGRRVTSVDIYRNPTADALSVFLDTAAPVTEPAPGADPDALVPLTRSQRQFWLAEQFLPGSPALRVVTVLDVDGEVDPAVLRAALVDCAARHEALRTVYPLHRGLPGQRLIDPDSAVRLVVYDAGHVLGDLVEDALKAPGELTDPPVLTALCTPGSLALLTHHIAMDGRSQAILVRDLVTAYHARRHGQAPRWPARAGSPRGYALAQAGRPAPVSETDRAWAARLRGAPDLALPGLQPDVPLAGQGVRLHPVTVPADVVAGLRALAGGRRATLYAALTAGYVATLQLAGAPAGLCVGCPVSGRTDPAISDAVGVFINTVPLRPGIDLARGFGDALDRTAAEVRTAQEFQHLTVEEIVAANGTPRTGRSPLYQSVLVYQDTPLPAVGRDGFGVRPVRWPPTAPMHELMLELWPAGDGTVAGHLHCAAQTVPEPLGRALAESYVRVLADGLRDAERPLSRLGSLVQ
ncbi:non-ribosomal peptide synthetase [Jidongwangia harbinensis]|uniref:non-ribosomal peptide synthetase n=1 Tax=Jidongwangia harbinensis TaxID=2878561 RepID=UPI001CDA251A|nr:non-ribosomal peptide synthetase [Jidongwangia harbinensis]MCA2211549.1 amino acid adenylation domain-containing protein [Jidongwangia harbinensis]